jgi:UDP-N-acetylglucosamine:LPS N-acetylglucosamine transferase
MSTLTPTIHQSNNSHLERLGSPPQQEEAQKANLTARGITPSFFNHTVSRGFAALSQTIPILSHACKSIVFSPSLENALAEKLDDIDRAQALAGFYKKFKKTLSIEDQSLLEAWLLKYCQILGSVVSKNERLLEELDSPAFQNPNFKSQLIKFLSGMDREIPIQKEAKRIAILYTGLGGGGHTAPAIAIKDQLIKEQYAVKMIDIDQVEKEFEPKILGRGHEDIWTEFYQRKGLPTLANFMWKLHHLFYLPQWRKTTQVIRNRLAEFNPALIFAVADHKPQLASLAYSLNRKMIFVHTDNKFSSKLAEIVRIQIILRNVLITFTKPTIAEPVSYNKTLPEIRGIRDQLIDLQIPVRQGFRKISRKEQNELKKEMGIDPATKVCLIMMGNNGVESEMRSILKRLYEERLEAKTQLHLIFVCGRNQALANELTSHKSSFNGTAITIDVRGFVEGPQMVKVAQSADVWISKMGGSSSAEALAARKYVLSVSIPSHKWEDRNALANQSCGLSSPLKQDEKILTQIDTACKKTLPTRYIPNWKQQLMHILTKC